MIKIQKVEPAGWKVTEDDTTIYFGEFGKFGCYQNDGCIYKDQKAFDTNKGVCYISEYGFDSLELSKKLDLFSGDFFYKFKHPEEIPEEFKYTILRNPYWSCSSNGTMEYGDTRESLELMCRLYDIDVEDLFNHLDWMFSETLIYEWTQTPNEEKQQED